MKCNVGKIDRIARVVMSIVLITWGLGVKNLIMIVIGISLLFTAITGSCLVYSLLKLNTGCHNEGN